MGTPTGCLAREYHAIRWIVFDDQHPSTRELDPRHSGRNDHRRGRPCRHREMKTRPATRLALKSDVAPEHLDQTLRNREAESGAAIFPGGRAVGLREGPEETPRLVRLDADSGVPDRDVNPAAVRCIAVHGRVTTHLDADLSTRGELDPVADEIHQNLPQSAWISVHALWHVARDLAVQLEALAVSGVREQLRHFLHQLVQVEVDLFQLQLSSFDLRKIEYVVDDAEKGLAGVVNELREPLLRLRQIGFE